MGRKTPLLIECCSVLENTQLESFLELVSSYEVTWQIGCPDSWPRTAAILIELQSVFLKNGCSLLSSLESKQKSQCPCHCKKYLQVWVEQGRSAKMASAFSPAWRSSSGQCFCFSPLPDSSKSIQETLPGVRCKKKLFGVCFPKQLMALILFLDVFRSLCFREFQV